MKEHLRTQRGFTLIENLVAIAIALIIFALLTYMLRAFVSWNRTLATHQAEHAQFGAFIDRLRADEDTAWAIFTPAADVLSKSNGDGHEIDFFTRDGENRPHFWAYRFDAGAHTVTKYIYTRPGASATVDAATTVTGVSSFKSATYTADKLTDSSSPIYAPVYATQPITPVAIHYGYGPEVAGGNAVTAVTISSATDSQSLQLSTQTAPSGWSVRFHYSKATLNTWPVAVLYGANGTNAASVQTHAPPTVASILNSLLGGSTAEAAVTCPAIAYKDSAMTQIDALDTTYRATLGVFTDSDGCIYGPSGADGYLVAEEQGFKGQFVAGGCQSTLNLGRWEPSAVGPRAALSTSGATVSGICDLTLSDGGSSILTYGHGLIATSVTINVAGGCALVAEQCSASVSWPASDSPQCDPAGGLAQGGWTGGGIFRVAPAGHGTLSVSLDGSTFAFLRTSSGPVIVTASATQITWVSSKTNPCNARTSLVPIQSWSLK